VAEVAIGEPQSLPATARVNALGGNAWAGQVTRIESDMVLYRVNPGSTGLEVIRPHHHVFVSMLFDLRNAAAEPQAVTAADIVAIDADQRQSAPLGIMGERGKTAAPITDSKAVASQAPAEPLHPVWDLVRTEAYTLRIYGPAAEVVLPVGLQAGEIAVDTAYGHLIAGREQHLAGQLQKAIDQYQTVIREFPGSDEEDEARARLADAEVAQVLKQQYMPLPPLQTQGRGVAGQQAVLEVEDAAGQALTLYLSGPGSQVVEI